MRFRFHKVDPSRNIHRYYKVEVTKDLFGGWVLLREWGRIGSPGQLRRLHCDDWNTTARQFEAIVARRAARGYVSV